MSLISAGSISLDSTFKQDGNEHTVTQQIEVCLTFFDFSCNQSLRR
jgi:hypothetical protein